MKYFLLAILIISRTASLAQVQIVTSNLPQANDILITQAATLLTDVNLEQIGPNQTWYFGSDVLQSSQTNTATNCVDVNDTPITYQFLFNSPFDPEHNSDYANGVAAFAVGTITFEDAYQYFQNNSQKLAMTGMGVSVNGIPLPAVANDPDVIYDLPLNYGDAGASNTAIQFDIPTLGFYGMNQTRTYEVDGWGTLYMNDMNFDVIRYRSVVNATDSLFVEALGFGFNFPRPESIEYQWISPLYNVPVLQIITSNGLVTSVETAEIFAVGIEEIMSEFMLYPNPANDMLTIKNDGENAEVTVTNMQGQTIQTGKLCGTAIIDLTNFSEGIYCIKVVSPTAVMSQLFVKN